MKTFAKETETFDENMTGLGETLKSMIGSSTRVDNVSILPSADRGGQMLVK